MSRYEVFNVIYICGNHRRHCLGRLRFSLMFDPVSKRYRRSKSWSKRSYDYHKAVWRFWYL